MMGHPVTIEISPGIMVDEIKFVHPVSTELVAVIFSGTSLLTIPLWRVTGVAFVSRSRVYLFRYEYFFYSPFQTFLTMNKKMK